MKISYGPYSFDISDAFIKKFGSVSHQPASVLLGPKPVAVPYPTNKTFNVEKQTHEEAVATLKVILENERTACIA